MEILYNHMNQISQVSRNSFNDYKEIFKEKYFYKGDCLIDFNQNSNAIYFIVNGLVKVSKKEDNREIVRRFSKSGEVVASNEANMYKTPSKIAIECLTDCHVLKASYDDIQNLTLKHKDIGYFQYRALQYQYNKLEETIVDIISCSPEERYLKFKEEYFNYSHLIPNTSLASYLNIDTNTLTSIQNKILNPIF